MASACRCSGSAPISTQRFELPKEAAIVAAGAAPGALPWAVVREEYTLEYGTDQLEIHRDALAPGDSVVIVDDVLATGGTAKAAVRLVEGLGATVAGCLFLLELPALGGRSTLSRHSVSSVITY